MISVFIQRPEAPYLGLRKKSLNNLHKFLNISSRERTKRRKEKYKKKITKESYTNDKERKLQKKTLKLKQTSL